MAKKTRFSLAFFLFLLVAQLISTTVHAEEVHSHSNDEYGHHHESQLLEEESNIEPRAQACFCGSFYYLVNTLEGDWKADQVDLRCTDGFPYGTDKIYRKRTIFQYRCNQCGGGFDREIVEIDSQCHGYY